MAKKFKIEPINKRHMTLHEAMEKLLREAGGGMTKDEIAEELNKNKWYQKNDCQKLAQSKFQREQANIQRSSIAKAKKFL